MEKLYDKDPYRTEFEAEVISCEKGKKGFEIILDRSAFYPEGGGQPYDTGMLGGVRVTEVHERKENVVHYTDGPLIPGTAVKGTIDWDRRFNHMQQHSGEHIVSGLIHEAYGYDNVGFHMGAEEVTVDLNGSLSWEQLAEIERAANRIVYEDVSLCVTYPTPEELKTIDYRSKKELTGQIRIVEVPGADVCACCGTHVAKTGEIGLIKFLSMIHYKGGVRISMLCGEKALLDCERKTDQINRLSVLLSAKPDGIVEAVEKLKQDGSDKEQQMAELTRQLFTMKAERYEAGDEPLLLFENGFEPVQLRQFANLLLEQEKGTVIAVCAAKADGGYYYCIGSKTRDMKALGKTLNSVLNGRGGGSSQMIQGSFSADEEQIRQVFKDETGRTA